MGKTTTGTGPEVEPEETEEVEPEDTEQVEPDADADEDDDEDAEAAVIATFTPEQAALWTAHQERLNKVNSKSRSQRLALKALRSGQQPPSTGPKPTAPKVPAKPGEQPAAFDPAAFRAELLAELKTEQNTTRVQTAAERALKAAGLVLPEGDAGERKLARVMRMVDWTGVDAAEVADEIDDLKTDHPELFKARKARPRTGGVAGPGTIKPHAKGGRESELFD